MNYGTIISESLNIFWKHKVLWLFGVILALFGQGEYGFRVNYQERYSYPIGEGGNVPNIPNPFENTIFQSFFENPIPFIIGFGVLAIVWWLISNFVGWLCQGALIGMVDEIDQIGRTSLKQGWYVGKGRVKKLFLLAIIFTLPQIVIFLPAIIGGLWIFSQIFDVFGGGFTGNFPPPEQMEERFASIFPTFFVGFACMFSSICVGVIVSWILGLLNSIAARCCVLENLGVMDSVRRGWNIVRKNIGYTLLNWFILAMFSGIFGLLGAAPALVLWIPTARAFLHNDWSGISVVMGILTIIYFVIMGIGIGGILTSFNSTLWTKLYKGFVAKESNAVS